MLKGVAEKVAEFDVVFSSYSLHHFQRVDKAALFQSVYAALKKGGVFVLIDTVRATDETLQVYYDHYLGYVSEHWRALSQEEIQRVSDHVRYRFFLLVWLCHHQWFQPRLYQRRGKIANAPAIV